MNVITKVFRLPFTIFLIVLSTATSFSYANQENNISLTHGIDESAGNVSVYIVTTASATYFLEKEGGGLSSMLDSEGVDWLGFTNVKGSGWKGEYRGFPNAIHKQDGNYFHALNATTDKSSSSVTIHDQNHIQIKFTSDNGKWEGIWDFYPDRCDFTMSKVSAGHHYWILYEGIPYGGMDSSDFWYSSADKKSHLINETQQGDLPFPEWIAFGDLRVSRMLYLLNHTDDEHIDEYVSRPYMTVFGFGRSGKNKFLNKSQKFSIGFVESNEYNHIEKVIKDLIIDEVN